MLMANENLNSDDTSIKNYEAGHLNVSNCAENTMLKMQNQGFPGGAVVENLPANAGDTGSSPGLGRSHMPRSN